MKTLVIILSFVLSLTVHASDKHRDGGTPREATERFDSELIELYLSLAELPLEDQRQQIWGLSSRTKAALWTYNIERYLRDHPQLSADAQQVLRDGALLAGTPGWFDFSPEDATDPLQRAALEHFKQRLASSVPREVIIDVFIRLGSEPAASTTATVEPRSGAPSSHRKVPRADIYGCTCSGPWECGYFSDSSCYESYCDLVKHCGVFGNEWCYGKCKSNGL